MSTAAFPPTAPTTLVIVLGASAWPNSPGFQASGAFAHAAQGFRDYMLDPNGFGLSVTNLLDLFDAQTSSSDQLEMLGSFLERRTRALEAANQATRDVLIYFVGHGGFAGPTADFYLMHRRTNASSLRASGMAIDALAEVLREKARRTRRYLFLDCCFAAAAFRSFQGGPDQTAITKTLNAFHVQARSRGFPRKGTVLLCSSDQKSPSLLLPDESCTMFSSCLFDVFKNGDLYRPFHLSLRDIKELTEDRLAALPEKNTPRPGLHSPDQSEGDVADVPFFPNPRTREERRGQAEETAVPLQRSAMLLPLPTPAVLSILILLTLMLLGGASLGVYGAATGNWPWNVSHGQATPNTSSKSTQANATAAAQANVTATARTNATSTARANASGLGQTWHIQHSDTSQILWSVAWSGSQFVAVGGTGTILTSPDGHTWNVQNSGTSLALFGVAWLDSQFMAVGDKGTILTSPNGRTWTAQNSGTSLALNDAAWSGSQFVVIGSGSTSIMLTSPDGRIWTVRNSGTSQILVSIIWMGSQFVAVGDKGTILTSSDGHTWTAQNSGTSQILLSVAWSGSQFVAVGETGTIPHLIRWAHLDRPELGYFANPS